MSLACYIVGSYERDFRVKQIFRHTYQISICLGYMHTHQTYVLQTSNPYNSRKLALRE